MFKKREEEVAVENTKLENLENIKTGVTYAGYTTTIIGGLLTVAGGVLSTLILKEKNNNK